MIDYSGRDWLGLLLKTRGSILSRLWGRILIATLAGGLAVWLHEAYAVRIPTIAHTMIGAALALLLVFRTNASYDRYWEGRRLLGGMVIRSRDLARQIAAWLPGEALRSERQALRNLICAYYRLVTQALRDEDELDRLEPLLDAAQRQALTGNRARAQTVLAWLTASIHRHAAAGALSETRLLAIDQNLTVLTDCFAGCERIARTPVPFAYAQHIKTFVVLFCFTAPFTMAADMRWYTPLAAAVLAFALFGIDEIGVEIEDPFGYDPNDLPVDAIGDGIERVTQAVIDAAEPGLASGAPPPGVSVAPADRAAA